MKDKNTSPEAAPAPPGEPKPDRAPAIYCAASFGALCLGIGDLVNNDEAATVLKVGEVIRQTVVPSFESVGLLALVILAVLGGAICWVHQPRTRVDAFTRGFSVFAILAVATPYQVPPAVESPIVPVEDSASASSARYGSERLHPTGLAFARAVSAHEAGYRLAGEPSAAERLLRELTRQWKEKGEGYGLAGIRIEAPRGVSELPQETVVKVRDARTAKVLSQKRAAGGGAVILQPKGAYVIEIEAPGYRRARFNIELGDTVVEYSVELEKSSVPLNLQRLVAAQDVVPVRAEVRIPR